MTALQTSPAQYLVSLETRQFVYFRLTPPVECSALGYVRRSHNAVSEAITISYFYEILYARWQNYKKFFTPAGKTKVTRVWRPVVS